VHIRAESAENVIEHQSVVDVVEKLTVNNQVAMISLSRRQALQTSSGCKPRQ
jgi:hypothetical protein